MQKNSENFSIQDAMRLAGTPAGQELIAMLQKGDTGQFQQAAELASAGNYTHAQHLLSQLLKDPKIRELMSRLGR